MASSKEDDTELEEQLERYKDLLNESNSERDDVSNKVQELGSKIDSLIQLHASDVEQEEELEEREFHLNMEFKQRFEQEMSGYRQRILSYQENQDKQSLAIKDLQSKLDLDKFFQTMDDDKFSNLHVKEKVRMWEEELAHRRRMVETYQQQCQRLERELAHYTLENVQQRRDATSPTPETEMDLPTALLRLEEEKNRSQTLLNLNTMLRDQLENATKANQDLTSDIHRLMKDWEHLKDELDIKEAEWREEEQSFNDYFTKEHHRLLALWRHLLKFRRNYSEMKLATERDLTQLRVHISHTSHNITSACLSLLTIMPPSQQANNTLAIDLQRKTQEILEINIQHDAEKNELNERIRDLNSEKERQKILLEEKERIITALNKTIETMESMQESIESPLENTALIHQLQEELNFTSNAILEIAQIIIKDADRLNATENFTDQLHTRQLFSLRSALQQPGVDSLNTTSSERPITPEITESTVAAVQAALNKYHLCNEELNAKLISCQEQLRMHKKMLDDVNDERRNLQVLNSQLSVQLSTVHQDFLRDRTLEETGVERSASEQVQRALNEQIDGLNAENDRLQRLVNESRRKIDNLEEEKEELKSHEVHLQEELNASARQNANLGQRISTLRDEVAGLREMTKKLRLDNEVLQEERKELKTSLLQSERKRTEVMLELEKLQYEENSLKDSLLNLQSFSETLEHDKQELNRQIVELQEAKRKLMSDKSNLEQEQQKLLNMISRLEQQLQEKEAKNAGLNATLQVAEAARDHLEEQLSLSSQANRELEVQLSSQSTKLKTSVEELEKVRQDLEKQQETGGRIAQEKEELVRQNSELQVRIGSLEEEQENLNNNLSTLQSEREQLEKSFYTVQQTVTSLQQKNSELVQELEDCKSQVESLKGQLLDLKKRKEMDEENFARSKEALNQKIMQLKDESLITIQQERQKHLTEIEKLKEEKESQISKLEEMHTQVIQQLQNDNEEIHSQHQLEVLNLKTEMSNLQREWEEKYTLISTEKKLAEDLISQEKATLTQKLQNSQKETARIEALLEETKQMYNSAAEKDRAALNDCQADIQRLKTELQNTVSTFEKEVKELNNHLVDAYKQRDSAQEVIVHLKDELQTSEKAKEAIKQELHNANERIREVEAKFTSLSKEKVTAWSQADAEKNEKEIVQKSNEELRSKLKALELEKAEALRNFDEAKQRLEILEASKASVQKEFSDLRGTLREVEKSRLDLKRELQTVRRHAMTLETQVKEQEQLILELQAGIAKEEQKQTDSQQDVASLKQKLMAAEAGREAARKEMMNLQKKVTDLDHRLQLEKDTHLSAIEDHQAVQQRWEEQRASFEKTLLQLNEESQELRLKLSIAEGKATALDSHISRLESAKQDVEAKLSSLHAALRLTLGLGTSSKTGASSPVSLRSPWSSRHGSPTKTAESVGESPVSMSSLSRELQSKSMTSSRQGGKWNVSEVDVEFVRAALYDLIQKLHAMEIEKDDWKSQSHRYQRLLEETKEEHSNVLSRMTQLQKFVGDVESGKKDTDSQLTSARATILQQEEMIQRLEKECKRLRERVNSSDQDGTPWESQKKYFLEKIGQLKQMQKQADRDRQLLIEAREKAEVRASKLELSRQMLEGEIQKLKLMLKESNNEKLESQQNIDKMNQRIHEIESKNSSLQVMVERLTLALQKSNEGESELREKVTTLSKSLNEKSSSAMTVFEQLKHLRRELGNSEQERQSLQSALEVAKHSLSEQKKKNKLLSEQLKQASNELHTSESLRSELSSELRSYHTSMLKSQLTEQDMHNLQQSEQEKRSLQEQVSQLQHFVTQMEAEKKHLERLQARLEKDKASLQRSLEKAMRDKIHTEELAHKSVLERSTLGHTLSTLEMENIELQKKIQNLQVQLAEAEQQHSQHMSDLAARYQHESHAEVERLRTTLRQAEQRTEARERMHQQKIAALEQQIITLKEQLAHEQARWQQYHQRSLQAGSEIRALRFTLDNSLRNVSENPLQLAQEARKLDSAIEQHLTSSPSVTLTTHSRISRSPSPVKPLVSPAHHTRVRRRLDQSSPPKE